MTGSVSLRMWWSTIAEAGSSKIKLSLAFELVYATVSQLRSLL
jgi:hypothetical protein